jgi:hypothetical protein
MEANLADVSEQIIEQQTILATATLANPAEETLTACLLCDRPPDMADAVMKRVHDLFDKSGMTLDELGQKMGYPKETARKSAWQFLRQTNDPRLSMLRKFAKAAGVALRDLVS